MPRQPVYDIPYSVAVLADSDRIDCGDNLDLAGDAPWSWEFKIRMRAIGTADGIIAKRTTSPFTGYLIRFNGTDGTLEFLLRGTTAANRIEVRTTDNELKVGKEYHVHMTYDGSGNASGVKFYVDGQLCSTAIDVDTYDGTSTANSASLDFGWDGLNATNSIDGSITDIYCHNGTELTQAQVDATIYQNDHYTATNWWPFVEGAGTTVQDVIGGIDGTLTGTCEWSTITSKSLRPFVEDHVYSLEYDGSINAGVETATDSVFDTQEYTMAAWVYPTDLSSQFRGIMNLNDGGVTARTVMLATRSSDGAFAYFDSNNGTENSGYFLKEGKWQFVAITVDADRLLTFYVNGKIVNQQTLALALDTGTDRLTLGGTQESGGGNETFEGSMSRNWFYNSALRPDQMRELFLKGRVDGVEPLVDYRHKDASGSSLADSGSGGFDGTINSGTSWRQVGSKSLRKHVQNFENTLHLTAKSHQVNFGASTDFDFTDEITLESRVFYEEITSGPRDDIMSKWLSGSAANQSYHLYFTNTGRLGFVARFDTAGLQEWLTDFFAVPGHWYHIVFTLRNGSDWTFYVNGEEVKTGSITADSMIVGTADFTLGARDGQATAVQGKLGVQRAWNVGLTQVEIERLYRGEKLPDTRPVFEALMKEGSGSSVQNTGSEGSAGSITGAAWSNITQDKDRSLVTVDRTLVT